MSVERLLAKDTTIRSPMGIRDQSLGEGITNGPEGGGDPIPF